MRDLFFNHVPLRDSDISIPEGLTTEEQLAYMVTQYNSLITDFNRLCYVVQDIQDTISRLINYTDGRLNDVEYVIDKHTRSVHTRLIVNKEKGTIRSEVKKDEDNIS